MTGCCGSPSATDWIDWISSGQFTHFRNDQTIARSEQQRHPIRAPRQAGHTLGCDRRGADAFDLRTGKSFVIIEWQPPLTGSSKIVQALAQCDTRWWSNLARSEDRAVHNVHLLTSGLERPACAAAPQSSKTGAGCLARHGRWPGQIRPREGGSPGTGMILGIRESEQRRCAPSDRRSRRWHLGRHNGGE